MIDVEASRSALVELRQARRHNHRDAVHWIDALYRVYISALIAVVAVLAGAGLFGDAPVPASEQAQFLDIAIPWLGLVFAFAVAIGLRSGGRGGPLTLEAATVQYELQAPLPYEVTLREPAIKQLRFLAFTGAMVGAVVGVLAVHRFPDDPVLTVVAAAAGFGLTALLAVSVAMITSGHRVGRLVANGLAVALLLWSAVDILLKTTTSPLSLLASLTMAGISFNPLSLITIVLVGAAAVVALVGIGGTSIDDARRRAGLVSQLRFAVTLQDIRTVVLLRRQLAQETPRARPWIRLKRGGFMPPVWRRDWRSYLRYPISRLGRMVLLAIVAGVCLGLTWNGIRPAFLVSAIALYLAGYDAVEPLAQEVDHPSRWDDLPEAHGKLLLTHLPAAFVVMVVVCLIAAASALLVAPSTVVFSLLPLMIVPVSAAAMVGAALSTVMGSPDVSKMLAGLGADVMGFVLMARLVFPPALTVAAMAPMFAAGTDINALNTPRVGNLIGYSLILSGLTLFYINAQKPDRV